MNIIHSKEKNKEYRCIRRSSRFLLSEINMTPFIDIILVLLIIFMISTPLIVNVTSIDLPKTISNNFPIESDSLIVSIAKDGRISIQKKYFLQKELVSQLKKMKIGLNNIKQKIMVYADKTSNYGKVLEVLSLIQKAGFYNISLASLPVYDR